MNSARRANSLLEQAESGLRNLMQEEIASGRYAELPLLASLADGVAALVRESGIAPPATESETSSQTPQIAVAPGRAGNRSQSPEPIHNEPRTSHTQVMKKRKYPYFEIADDWIGKVGWSKKNRKEYRHFAQVSAAVSLAEHIDRTQKAGRVWTVEDLGEVVDPETGEALPSYQVYLLIAWMRYAELLTKQGRSGYVAVGGGTLKPGVERSLAST